MHALGRKSEDFALDDVAVAPFAADVPLVSTHAHIALANSKRTNQNPSHEHSQEHSQEHSRESAGKAAIPTGKPLLVTNKTVAGSDSKQQQRPAVTPSQSVLRGPATHDENRSEDDGDSTIELHQLKHHGTPRRTRYGSVAKVEFDAVEHEGLFQLLQAADCNDIEAAEDLLATHHSAKVPLVRGSRSDGETALMIVTKFGCVPFVSLLLRSGADPLQMDRRYAAFSLSLFLLSLSLSSSSLFALISSSSLFALLN